MSQLPRESFCDEARRHTAWLGAVEPSLDVDMAVSDLNAVAASDVRNPLRQPFVRAVCLPHDLGQPPVWLSHHALRSAVRAPASADQAIDHRDRPKPAGKYG